MGAGVLFWHRNGSSDWRFRDGVTVGLVIVWARAADSQSLALSRGIIGVWNGCRAQ